MKKLLLFTAGFVGLFLLLIVVVIALGPVEEPPDEGADAVAVAEQPETEPERELQWTEVARWEGNGAKDTETFVVASREWRNPTSNVLAITVYDAQGGHVSLAANTMAVGVDTSYVRSEGSHYLSINATGPWSVVVEDQR